MAGRAGSDNEMKWKLEKEVFLKLLHLHHSASAASSICKYAIKIHSLHLQHAYEGREERWVRSYTAENLNKIQPLYLNIRL